MTGGDLGRLAAGAALLAAAAAVGLGQAHTAALLSVAGAAPAAIAAMGAALGAAIVYLSWPRRIGRAPHCGRCGYRHDQRGRLLVVCPECGSPWRWIGWSKAGRPIGSAPRTAVGVLLWAAACSAAALRNETIDAVLRVVPAPLLANEVVRLPDGALCGQAQELRRRGLSGAAAYELTGALEEKQRRQGPLSEQTRELLEEARSAACADPG